MFLLFKNILFFTMVGLVVALLFTLTFFWADTTWGLGLPSQWLAALEDPDLTYKPGTSLFNFWLAWFSMTVFCWTPVILFPSISLWMLWGAIENRREFTE